MEIYSIEQDFNYFEVDLRPTDIEDYFPESFQIEDILGFSRKNIQLKEFWPEVYTDFVDTGEKLSIPDISIWMDGVLLLSPLAKLYSAQLLNDLGEFLPIFINGEEWSLFNCLAVANQDSRLTGSSSIVFEEARILDKHLFKSISNDDFGLFCTERFKSLVDQYNLDGLSIKSQLFDCLSGESKKLQVI